MSQPRRYVDHAARQRAYRARQAQAEQQAKGLPPTPPLPTIPARARWQALVTQARSALETVDTEMLAYYDARSEPWQESERGITLAEDLDQLALRLEELAPLCADEVAAPASPTP